MVSLLTGTNQQLLVNVTKAVGECAQEQENMAYATFTIQLKISNFIIIVTDRKK